MRVAAGDRVNSQVFPFFFAWISYYVKGGIAQTASWERNWRKASTYLA